MICMAARRRKGGYPGFKSKKQWRIDGLSLTRNVGREARHVRLKVARSDATADYLGASK